jgi:hypothetical protein
MAGARGRAFEDLRVGKSKGIRPGMFQALFAGGAAVSASEDARMGKPGSTRIRPGERRPLFRGGTAAPAADDVREGTREEERLRPDEREPLAEGGEAEFECSPEELVAGHEILDAVDKLHSLSGEEGRNEQAANVVRAIKALYVMFDSEPHEEGPHEEEGEED